MTKQTEQQTQMDLQHTLEQAFYWFHQNPELSGSERQTTEHLRQLLLANGVKLLQTPLETGLVAIVRGSAPGPTVALRGDIDALPVTEESGLNYASSQYGTMHACGHDFHMTALLGAALLLQAQRESLSGNVKLVFQPSEEHSNGAEIVLRTGALDDVSEIYGIHVMPGVTPGAVALCAGANHAAVGWFEIRINGRGGHAAMPHTGADPIVALGQLIGALQTIVSRNVNPFDNAVVSVTHVSAGSTWNVIPAGAYAEGTLRVFSNEMAKYITTRIEQVCAGIAESSGTSISVSWKASTPATDNDPALVAFAAETATSLGIPLASGVPTMTGEDFAEYQQRIPGVFFHIGAGGDYPLHQPKFFVDPAYLSTGARYLAALGSGALKRLSSR